MMARFLLESNRKFCAIFRRQVQKSCQETAGKLFIEDGVVVITNEKPGRCPGFQGICGTDVPHQETIAGQTERPCHSSPSLGREILGLGLLEFGVVP